MDHFDKNRKHSLEILCTSNNNGIKMMLGSLFYGFKNDFQNQTNDAPLMSQMEVPVKILSKMLHEKSLVSI